MFCIFIFVWFWASAFSDDLTRSAVPIARSINLLRGDRRGLSEEVFAKDLYGKRCPVSQKITYPDFPLTESDIFSYPLDILDQSQLNEIQKNTTNFKLFNCPAIDCWYPNPNPRQTHICSTYHTCPVMKGNVEAAVERMNNYINSSNNNNYNLYENHSSLCYIHEQLHNKSSKVNIYVFGGSVTKGHDTEGCTGNKDAPRPVCTWLQFLFKWFKISFSAEITIQNLAIPGEDSALMSEDFQHTVMLAKIKSFTSNDIVFLDHSTNDAQIRQTDEGIHAFKRGLEKLLFKIFRHSQPGSFPTVVLLSANPTSKMYGKYIETYQEVAQHYNVMLWSYSDVVMSNFAKQAQSEYIKLLNYDKIWGVIRHGLCIYFKLICMEIF